MADDCDAFHFRLRYGFEQAAQGTERLNVVEPTLRLEWLPRIVLPMGRNEAGFSE